MSAATTPAEPERPKSLALSVISDMGLQQVAGEIDPIDAAINSWSGPPVQDSDDLRRILALPRRSLNPNDPRAAEAWTAHLRRERSDPCDCDQRWGARDPKTGAVIPGSGCIRKLRPIQGWALEEASNAGG